MLISRVNSSEGELKGRRIDRHTKKLIVTAGQVGGEPGGVSAKYNLSVNLLCVLCKATIGVNI